VSELGDMLRNAREKKNLSINAVAEAIRIKPSYLEALEHDEYAALPGPAYITGFLRNYASYLGLHPDDIVQEYYALRPPPKPSVKAATRVLATGYERHNRKRLLWMLGALVVVLAGAYAVKQYNEQAARSYSAPLNVTAASLGASITPVAQHRTPKIIHLKLRAVAAVWVRVTVDGTRKYQGIMHAHGPGRAFTGHHSIYVVTYDGSHLKATYDGRHVGTLSPKTGLTVNVATPASWHSVS
jgi:transcriptional regulator with XRE-family HTH domain